MFALLGGMGLITGYASHVSSKHLDAKTQQWIDFAAVATGTGLVGSVVFGGSMMAVSVGVGLLGGQVLHEVLIFGDYL
jgi:hypothetical protein